MNLGLAAWLATLAIAGDVDPLLAGLAGADRVTIERGASSWVIRVDGRSATVSPPVTAEQRELVRALAVCLLADLALVPAVPPVPAADPVALRVLGTLATPEPAQPLPPPRPAAPAPSTPAPSTPAPSAGPRPATHTKSDSIGVVGPPAETTSVIVTSAPAAALDPAPAGAGDVPAERVPSPAPPPSPAPRAPATAASPPPEPAPTAVSTHPAPAPPETTPTTPAPAPAPTATAAPAPATIPPAAATSSPPTAWMAQTAPTIAATAALSSPTASTVAASSAPSSPTAPTSDPPPSAPSAPGSPSAPVVAPALASEPGGTGPAEEPPSAPMASFDPPMAPPADPRRPRPRPRPGPTRPPPLAPTGPTSAGEPPRVDAPGAARWSHGLEIGVRHGLAPAIGPSSELVFGRDVGLAVRVATVASRQTAWSSTGVWTASLDAAPALFAQLAVLRIDGGVGVSARTYARDGAIVAGHLMPVASGHVTVALPVGPLWLRVGGGPAVDLGVTRITWRDDPWTAAGAAIASSEARLPGVAWSVRVALAPHHAPTEAP